MALGGKVLDLMFDLYGKGFFKEINSVIDMGDQDVNATFNEIQNKFENYKVKFNERDWANAKIFQKDQEYLLQYFGNLLGLMKLQGWI